MTMNGFESKTLKRKFDSIVFGTVAGPQDVAMPHSMASAGASPSAQPAGSPMSTAMQHMTAGVANVGERSLLQRHEASEATA